MIFMIELLKGYGIYFALLVMADNTIQVFTDLLSYYYGNDFDSQYAILVFSIQCNMK